MKDRKTACFLFNIVDLSDGFHFGDWFEFMKLEYQVEVDYQFLS
ncbi:MAG: hypothetical protein Hyperionvirus1_154 [Hyperionvirus sp.]|uniref:Uncharacterized protein n=1 Tax=Hyperionvirus sp. TaxID=2487770 RepID=A0A3G5A5Q2_9VIRU|nr:MAG: hypothetical protein Hyperionvirus1_154 [Hyperionvirus sp.]